MDQRTDTFAEEVTKVISTGESVAQKLEAFERRLTDMAEEVTKTYSRMLLKTTAGVMRMADQTAAALNPLHQTREHPGVMFGLAGCAGYVIARVHTRAHAVRKAVR
ncbi:MAG: hypothetical protein ACXWWJ_01260 [Nitrospira sp.]